MKLGRIAEKPIAAASTENGRQCVQIKNAPPTEV
jgi:hypothetical protein